jgi:hypothetical protein
VPVVNDWSLGKMAQSDFSRSDCNGDAPANYYTTERIQL